MPKELLREEKGWPNDVGHNSWWHVKHGLHAAHNLNLKRWDNSDIPGGGTERLKDPPTRLKMTTTLEKDPPLTFNELQDVDGVHWDDAGDYDLYSLCCDVGSIKHKQNNK